MAKKVSKRSRAARRGLEIDEAEAKSLAELPRAESNSVQASIIRTTIKNEELLNQKMKKQQDSKGIKKKNQMISRAEKSKQEKALKLDGKLSSKIEQSIDRAKKVQVTRKAGWDQINKELKTELNPSTLIDTVQPKQKTAEEIEREEEDAAVAQFFANEDEGEAHQAKSGSEKVPKNAFELLGEIEA